MLSVASQKMELSLKNVCKECQNSYIEALQHNIEDEEKEKKPLEKVLVTENKTVF